MQEWLQCNILSFQRRRCQGDWYVEVAIGRRVFFWNLKCCPWCIFTQHSLLFFQRAAVLHITLWKCPGTPYGQLVPLAGWPLPLGCSGLRAAQAFTPALREPVEGCGREHSSAQGSLFAWPGFLWCNQDATILLQLSKLGKCIASSVVVGDIFHPSLAAVFEWQ